MVRQVQVHEDARQRAAARAAHASASRRMASQAFPRMLKPVEEVQGAVSRELISTGVAGLDEMLGGGTLRGNAVLIAGPVGSGQDDHRDPVHRRRRCATRSPAWW